MDWTTWLELSADEFEEKFCRLLAHPLAWTDVIALYNQLIAQAHNEPLRVAATAGLLGTLFQQRELQTAALLFTELQARCHFLNRNADLGFDALEALIALDPKEAKETALNLARDVHGDLDWFGSSIDHRPKVLAAITNILQHYGEFEQIADIHLEVAMLYSGHNATQAAYRSVADAESIARNIRSLPLLARTFKTAAVVAAEEEDYAWSARAARKSIKAYRLAKIDPPADLLSNLGVARTNLDQLEPAVANLRAALERMPQLSAMRSAVKVNLAACLRRLGYFDLAEIELASADAEQPEGGCLETDLELAFGKAKLAEARKDMPRLILCLKEITEGIDAMLAQVLRLHHRRGIREQYVKRIEALLWSLPDKGSADDVLLALVASMGNAFGDWLAIIAWADLVMDHSKVPPALAQELKTTLTELRNLGVPHLYGFREKYDDPWSVGVYGAPWDRLSNIGRKLDELGLGGPLEEASSRHRTELCSTRLADGHCLMAITYAGECALLWYFIGMRYRRVAIDYGPIADWKEAQFRYASGVAGRSAFAEAIETLTNGLAPIVDPVFEEIAEAGCRSVRFIQDFASDLPITLLALRNQGLSKRMESGQFEVRVVPALHGPLDADAGSLHSVATIVDPDDDLVLAPYEGAALANAAALPKPAVITTDQEDDIPIRLAGHDILIVSTHGHSLQFFTDAYFAQLGSPGRPHPIRVESLQRIATDLETGLVILNTCYSGSVSSRNFYKEFITSDTVAIPSLFLLNRRAVAVAGRWKISDTASFMFASLVGAGLKLGMAPSAAIASAIARLRNLSKAAALEILATNLDASTFEAAAARLNNAPDLGLFSQPYFTGGLMIHGLV